MRFVSYTESSGDDQIQLGIELFGVIYDLPALIATVTGGQDQPVPPVPDTIWAYHLLPPEDKALLQHLVDHVADLSPEQRGTLIRRDVRRLAPVPHPNAIRCFSTFEGHTRIVRQRRGLNMPTEWYDVPGFFFGNHSAVCGHLAEVPQPASFWVDYELQVACVIGKKGRNIRPENADAYIAGYTIANDWCARDLEMYELRLGMGIAKGRDFAVSLGPTLVTPDELVPYALGEGAALRYDLDAQITVNNRTLLGLSRSNFGDMHFSFAQMIERASADTWLYPGDVLLTGAVNNGSLLSIGAEDMLGRWLQPGDVIDLEVTGLGVLRNTLAPPSA